MVILVRLMHQNTEALLKAKVLFTVMLLSVIVHIYQLGRPNMDVFFPYNSVIHEVFGVEVADGRLRYLNLVPN